MPLFAEAAFAVSVSDVSLATEDTVPIRVVPSLLSIASPACTSVVGFFPEPLTVVDEVLVLIVPDLTEPVHVVETFQFAVARDVTAPVSVKLAVALLLEPSVARTV